MADNETGNTENTNNTETTNNTENEAGNTDETNNTENEAGNTDKINNTENEAGKTDETNNTASRDSENQPPKEKVFGLRRPKPSSEIPTLAPIDFRDVPIDDFSSKLLENKSTPKDPGLAITFKSVLDMYSTPELVKLSNMYTSKVGARGGAHTPSLLLYCYNSLVGYYSRFTKPIAQQLIKLYDETFNENVDDRKTFKELYDCQKESRCHFHIVLLVCKSSRDGKVFPTDCEVIAGLSCSCDREVGTVLKWIVTNTQRLLTTELVSTKKADNQPLHGRGIGTLLLVVLQSILEICDYETTIFAQINVENDSPGRWYREKLFFAPCVRHHHHLPQFVKKHLLDDPEHLVLYNSTIKIRDIFIKSSFEDTVSVDTMLVNSRAILSSYAMPHRTAAAGVVHSVPTDVYERMQECIKVKVGPSGVKYADTIDGSPSGSLKEIFGNDPQLIQVWAKYVAAAPELNLRNIKTNDHLMGNCRGVTEEKSCFYLCLSHAVFGSTKYYWQLRMIAAYSLYALSQMRATHPLLNPTTYMFSTALIAEIIERDSENAAILASVGGQRHKMEMEAVRRYARMVISGTSDAAQTEVNILAYILKLCNVYSFSAYTKDQKPRRRGANQRRTWFCNLGPLGSGNEVFYPIDTASEVIQGNTDYLIFAHVQGIHYVTLEFTDLVPVADEERAEFGEFAIPFEDYEEEEEEKNVMGVDDTLRKFLGKELREKARNGLYNFDQDEKDFNAAVDYVAERTTKDEESKLIPFWNKRKKLDAVLLKIAAKGEDFTRTQLDNKKYLRLKIAEMERRRDADESNKDIEASLHLAERTRMLMFDGKQFFAVVEIVTQKKQVIVAVERDWVESRFHKSFLHFMRTFGMVAGYTELDDPKHFAAVEAQGNFTVVEIQYRYYFNANPAYYRYFVKYKKQGSDAADPKITAEVSKTWLDEQVEPIASLDSRCDTCKDRLAIVSCNIENCPCFGRHSNSDDHTGKCWRQSIVETLEDDNFVFQLDRRQIHSVRWDERRMKWQGLCKSMKADVQDDVQELTDEWVLENFSHELIESFKSRGQERRLFVKVPPGAPRSDCTIPDSLRTPNAPRIAFLQEQGYCCVTHSLASALHFLNRHTLASELHELGMSLTSGGKQRKDTILGETREFMRQKGRAWTPHKIAHSVDLTDPTGYPSPSTPRLVVLEAEDGDAGHAVTIVGQWIFDSNFETALPLGRTALDFICGSGGAMTGFKIGYDFRSPSNVDSTTQTSKKRKRKRKKQVFALAEDAGVL